MAKEKILSGHNLDAYLNFDKLPDGGFVKQPVITALEQCSDATFWRRVKAGLIPKPDKLGSGRSNTWNVGKYRASRNSRMGSA
jgi:predicted DNA-binding transcriptional regulator AlpA